MPPISVLMPVYNCQTFLRESIESILAQKFSDFEFIIIDDGSTDGSPNIIQEYASRDKRIQAVRNPKNKGLIETLTIGNRYCHGEFIARMDADDISLPDRLELQYAYLISHPEIDVLGANSTFIDEKGNPASFKLIEPSDSFFVWLQMFFRCSIHHPTVLARSEVYKRFNELGFENTFIHAEDYAFWLRVGFECKFANLDIFLVNTRSHHRQVSTQNKDILRTNQAKAAQRAYQTMLGRKIPLDVMTSFMFHTHLKFTDTRVNQEAIRTMYSLARAYIKRYPLTSPQKKIVKDYIYDRIAALAADHMDDRRVRLNGLVTRLALDPVRLFSGKLASYQVGAKDEHSF